MGEESGWGRSQGAIFSRKWLFLSPSSCSVLGPALTPPQLGGVQGGVGLMAVRMGSATTDVVPAFSRGHLGEPRPPRPPPGPPSGQLSACLIHRRGWGWGRTSSRTSAVLGPAAEPGHLVRVRVSDLPSEAEGGCAPHRKWLCSTQEVASSTAAAAGESGPRDELLVEHWWSRLGGSSPARMEDVQAGASVEKLFREKLLEHMVLAAEGESCSTLRPSWAQPDGWRRSLTPRLLLLITNVYVLGSSCTWTLSCSERRHASFSCGAPPLTSDPSVVLRSSPVEPAHINLACLL